MPKGKDCDCGLCMKYQLKKWDGREVDPKGHYFVLKLNSGHKAHRDASLAAASVYAEAVKVAYPQLSKDLKNLVEEIRLADLKATTKKVGGTWIGKKRSN